MKLLFVFIVCASACVSAQAATITLNESVLVNPSPMRIGVNVSTSTSYDSGQLAKNLLFTENPGFEGVIQQEIIGCISGSATTCVNNYAYDQAPSNYWAGATAYFCCSASPSNPNFGLTRTIVSSTTAAGSVGPTYTFSPPLPQPVATDDYFSVALQIDSTGPYMPGWALSGAAAGETSNISPGSAGVQALSLQSGACATTSVDFTGTHDFVLLQTGQTFGFNLKTIAISGSPVITVTITRLGGYGGGVSPSSNTLTPGASWATQSLSFSGAESPGMVYGGLQVQLCNSGTGTAYVDDVDLERTSNLNPSNTSIYRDEVVSSLAAIHPGSLRLWDYQLGETLADWTNLPFGRHGQASLESLPYVSASTGRTAGSEAQGLMDFLGLCEVVGAKAWITIPLSWPASDYSNLIDFLAGGPGTTYGAKRIANGHAATYTSTLGNIYIEFGDEPWNSQFAGINMPNFSYATTSNGMLSYAYWSNTAMSAMKANANFSPALLLIVNMQASNNWEYITQIAPNNPHLDAVSIAPYIGGSYFDFAGTLAAEWNPDTAFTWGDTNDTAGDSGNGWTYAYVKAEAKPVYVYEDNENQIAGNVSATTFQNHASSFMAGTVVAQQMLEHLKILGPNAPQQIWSLAQDEFNSSSVEIPLYGIMKEAGGEWAGSGNYIQRPVALATQIANDSIIGPEYSATVTGADTYITGASNGLAAESNVPYEFAYCFMNNSSRSCALVNTDPSNSHTFALTGFDVPTSVTTRVLTMAGGTIDTCNNETSSPCVSIVTTNSVPVYGGAITVPPGTIEGIDFVSTGVPPVITNVAAGSTAGTSATITWTTDQPSSSQVEYGLTTGYSSLSALNSSFVTSHSVTLTGLTPGTVYNYAVVSVGSGGSATSANFTFSTSPASIPAISAVTSGGVTATSATITWSTDQASSSQVEYGTTTAYGSLSALNSSMVTSHSVTLTGLTPGTTYDYAVMSADSAGTAISANFTFSTLSTSITAGIFPVGGAYNNTGPSAAPTSLSIGYSSSNGNTIVAVCALGSTSSSIGSITDSGSTWAFQAYASNGTTLRSEIWSTSAGGSVASTAFTINIVGGAPASCGIEEYSGVLSIGTTATASGTSGIWSVGITTQDANDYLVAGIGANSFYSYSSPTGTIRQAGGATSNPGSNLVEMALCDNTAAAPMSITCAVNTASSPWAAPALELRSALSIPVISAVASSGVTATSATITWTTDQASSSQVEFGTTTGYGSLSALNSSLVTSHSVSLTGLTPGTTYGYAALSADSAGTASSANFIFSTPATIPAISAVTSSGVTATSATITWTTDQSSSSQVEYGTTVAYGSLSAFNSSSVTSHSVSLTGLNAGTTYNFAVMSTDSAGTATSANFTFSTPATIPTISAVASSGVTGTSATITWTTDQGSSSQVEFGATTAYGSLSALNSSSVTSHSVSLTGLTAGTTYNYAVISTDSAGTATSANFTFSTPATIPTISAVASSGVTATSATITWTTDQSSSSQVEYGTTTAYGSLSALNSSSVTSHSVSLTGLTAGTTYNFAVMSTDSAGTATSANFTFSTPATIPTISAVASSGVTATSATITWTTDQSSNSQVEYGTTTAYGSLSALNSSSVTSHSVSLTGLNAGTTYNFAVMSTDSAGTATSANFTFSTPATIPTISAVTSSGVTATSATITWTTDQGSSSQVEYGTTMAYGSLSALNSSFVTSHSVTLTGLTSSTTYNYAVLSTDSAGTATSANFTFSTPATIPTISAVTSSGVTATSATITWTTDQASSSQVEFGTTTAYGSLSALNASLVTSHSVTLTGLAPGTTYDYAALSADSAGTAASANFTFSTPALVLSSTISRVGGAANNTGGNNTPASLLIPYTSSNGNTIVAVCALGSSSSSISSITDSGSVWNLRAYVNNGTAVRSEIWSTGAGGSVASTSFTINMSAGSPTSCALEEYAGVLKLGATATNAATSGTTSVSLTTQDANNYVVAGLGANSYYGYNVSYGMLRQTGGFAPGSGTNSYAETALCDNTAATPFSVTCSSVSSSAPWAASALELRSSNAGAVASPVISAVTSSGVTATSATITWTTDQPSSSQVEYGTTTGYGTLSTLSSSLVTSHSVTLSGLTPGTAYDFAAISADSAGTATSANFTFSTPLPAPVISAVTSSGIATTSATITWTTDQPSSSRVEYGTTAAYGTLSTLNAALVTSHSVTLTGLAPGTTYDYAVMSADSGGTTTSGNFTFSSTATIPTISAVTSSGVTGTSATITWTTDQASSSQVAYGTTTAYGSLSTLNSSLVTSHSVTLTGLTPGTTYDYAALSADSAGTTTSANFTFSTPATIPTISAVASGGVTATSATITWTTDQASSSQAEFGTTTTYGSLSALNSSLVTSHSATLTGLTPGTTYDYAVMSADSAGAATSVNFTFSTPAKIPTISAVASSGVTATSATITWTTDQGSSSQVEYGASTAYGSLSALNSSLVTSHSVTLTGLTPGSTYDYAALSADSAGTAVSANFTFSTPSIPITALISPVGGAHNTTGSNNAPTSLSIAYASGNGNTIVAVCALGKTSSSISSITDGGSTWAFRAYASNGAAVRSEIWSTSAGGSVASTSFTINISGGAPASCALEEYSGVQIIGTTATSEGTSGAISVSLTTQEANDYVVAGLGANSYSGYNVNNGTSRQAAGMTSNSGNNYVEMDLCDNKGATVTSVTCSSVSASAPWAAPALELR